AENLVVIGGLNWAFDLSMVPQYRIAGYNIIYATHPYGGVSDQAPSAWDFAWGSLTETDPVIATEFGDLSSCDAGYNDKLIKYANLHNAGWTAWAWFPGGCTFPALIDDWSGTPTKQGMVVKTALAGY